MASSTPFEPGSIDSFWALQQVLQSEHSESELASILARELGRLPGVSQATACVAGYVCSYGPAGEQELPGEWALPQSNSLPLSRCCGDCPIKTSDIAQSFPIGTLQAKYGELFLDCGNPAVLTPFRSYVSSIADLVGLRVENNRLSGLQLQGEELPTQEAVPSGEVRDWDAGHYRLLLDFSPDGIVVLDPETTRILEFNETAHAQLGYTREEFARLTLADIDVLESPHEIHDRIHRVMHSEKEVFETHHRTRKGEIRDVLVAARCTWESGQPIYHCIWRDVTERKRTEKELLRRIESEQLLSRISSDFIALDFSKADDAQPEWRRNSRDTPGS